MFNPFPLQKYDLIHAFNRIPIGTTSFIIGFESHLPRAFGWEHTPYFKCLSQFLASDRCKGIYAISEYARRQFREQHRESEWLQKLEKKLHVRYPNIFIPPECPETNPSHSGLQHRLVFIGNHFARKGGTAIIRLAQMAHQEGFPLHIDIISSLQVGGVSWVDPLEDGYFTKDLSLLKTLPNMTLHGSLPNTDAIAIIRKSHFLLLPTLSDSFGFSAIESMAQGIPVIATNQGALPEFITHMENGILINIPTTTTGEWMGIHAGARSTPSYSAFFDTEVDNLASQMLIALQRISTQSTTYQSMRRNAYITAKSLFNADDASLFWDNAYRQSV